MIREPLKFKWLFNVAGIIFLVLALFCTSCSRNSIPEEWSEMHQSRAQKLAEDPGHEDSYGAKLWDPSPKKLLDKFPGLFEIDSVHMPGCDEALDRELQDDGLQVPACFPPGRERLCTENHM